jgi:hypothetical protein
MKAQFLFSTTIALMLISGAIAPQIAQANIDMSVSNDEGYYFLTAPVDDTTVPAYGGRLRLYDVHIAKMFEMTHYYCKSASSERVLKWRYSANRTSMGEFHISCDLASDIAVAYGLGKTEYTPTSGRPANVPTLNITGGKVDKWIRFTNTFKPVR